MLNEERIRLMTKIAIYESGEGKENIPVTHYYRTDYVALTMIKSVILGTLTYTIGYGLNIVYQIETKAEGFLTNGVESMVKNMTFWYLIFMACYLLVSYVVANVKYVRGCKSVRHYRMLLKKVNKMHEREERLQPPSNKA